RIGYYNGLVLGRRVYIVISFIEGIAAPTDEDDAGYQPEQQQGLALADVGIPGFVALGLVVGGGLAFRAGILQSGDQVFAGGKVQPSVIFLEQGPDPFDVEGFADVQQLAARSQVEVQVGGGQGFHFTRMFFDIGDQVVARGSNIGVGEGDAGGRLVSYPVGVLGYYCTRIEGKGTDSRKVHLAVLIQKLR